MAKDNGGFGLYHRGEDEPLLTAPEAHADLLQRTRKREFGLDPAYKVAPLDSDVDFPEEPTPQATTAGLDQLKAEARQRASQKAIQEAVDAEVAGEGQEAGDEAEQIMEDQEQEQEDADEASDEQLTGDALNERAAELDIEGRSAMNADEKRAAIAAAEADQDNS